MLNALEQRLLLVVAHSHAAAQHAQQAVGGHREAHGARVQQRAPGARFHRLEQVVQHLAQYAHDALPVPRQIDLLRNVD